MKSAYRQLPLNPIGLLSTATFLEWPLSSLISALCQEAVNFLEWTSKNGSFPSREGTGDSLESSAAYCRVTASQVHPLTVSRAR